MSDPHAWRGRPVPAARPGRYLIPAWLWSLARQADATPARVRPERARQVAELILQRLPVEDPGVTGRRRGLLHAANEPMPRGQRRRRLWEAATPRPHDDERTATK